jgi:PAS domain S-box-containing protein/putative nucleotidyltransferase with HDIG domain
MVGNIPPEFHRALLECSADAVLLTTGEGSILASNQSASTMFGHSEEELCRIGRAGIVAPADARSARMIEARAVEGRAHSDVDFVRADGSTFPARVITSLFDDGRGGSGAVVIIRDMTAHTELEAHALRLNRIMQAIRRINEYLLVAHDETALYQYVCDTLVGLDDAIAVWIGLASPDFTIDPVAAAGVDVQKLRAAGPRWDERGLPLAGLAIRERRSVRVDDIHADPRLAKYRSYLGETLCAASIVNVPIQLEGKVVGVLQMWSGKKAAFDDESVGYLAEVAGDIAVGVRSLRQARRIEATLESLQETLHGTVEAIAAMVEYRDPYTAGHERRVARLATAIGVEMGMNEKRLEGLGVMGYIHDLGKISVPAEILSKPSSLSEIETALIRQHADTGYQILRKLTFPWPVADAVRQHHERIDGSGYPQGLKGEEILLEARILAVADTVEAMGSHRPYRPSKGIEPALEEIARNRGRLYDAEVVDACLRLFRERGFTLVD